jgi:glucose/arabinose dehydrogenase
MAPESTFAAGLNNPRGLAFDSFGNLFVAENNAAPDGDILEFALGGGAPTVFASGIDAPEFLTFGPPR